MSNTWLKREENGKMTFRIVENVAEENKESSEKDMR